MEKRKVFRKDLKELREEGDGQKRGVGSVQLELETRKRAADL